MLTRPDPPQQIHMKLRVNGHMQCPLFFVLGVSCLLLTVKNALNGPLSKLVDSYKVQSKVLFFFFNNDTQQRSGDS